jgi:hypothetical protein
VALLVPIGQDLDFSHVATSLADEVRGVFEDVDSHRWLTAFCDHYQLVQGHLYNYNIPQSTLNHAQTGRTAEEQGMSRLGLQQQS